MAHRGVDAADGAASFEALVGPWVDEMYRAAAAIVGETDARDVTQDIDLRPLDDLMLEAVFPAAGQACAFGSPSPPRLSYFEAAPSP